jgi:polyhydroxyalkanoate synthesis regulator phasin
MQDKHEKTDLNDIISAFTQNSSSDANAAEHKMTSEEAAAKVDELFAQAREQNKRKNKKETHSSSDPIPSAAASEKPSLAKVAEQKADELFTSAKKTSATKKSETLSSDVASLSEELNKGKLTSEEAEKKISQLLTDAKNPNVKADNKNISAKSIELIIVLVAAVILFVITLDSGLPGPLSPIAILLPALFGIGYRLFKKQLPLNKSVSESIPHIILSGIFMGVVIFAYI